MCVGGGGPSLHSRRRMLLGVRMTGYHGHFFIRSMDLLALPCVSPENSFGYQLALDEPVQGNLVCFQAGLLYTTNFGTTKKPLPGAPV